MLKKTVALLCSLYVVHALGQNKSMEELTPDLDWGEGSIMLNSGSELKGLLKYNDRIGVLSYESGENSTSYTARSVTGFEFFDEKMKKQRVFYSLEYEDSNNNAVRPLFFEVLKDFKKFAILSKIDPVKIEHKRSAAAGFNGIVYQGSGRTYIHQTETIYFLSEAGAIEPYIKVTRKVVDRDLYDREKMKNKVIDSDVIFKYFPKEDYEMLKQYAKENDLDVEIKEDFVKILDYYSDWKDKH